LRSVASELMTVEVIGNYSPLGLAHSSPNIDYGDLSPWDNACCRRLGTQ